MPATFIESCWRCRALSRHLQTQLRQWVAAYGASTCYDSLVAPEHGIRAREERCHSLGVPPSSPGVPPSSLHALRSTNSSAPPPPRHTGVSCRPPLPLPPQPPFLHVEPAPDRLLLPRPRDLRRRCRQLEQARGSGAPVCVRGKVRYFRSAHQPCYMR